MQEIKIDKGVPVPAGRSRYPVRDMAVGDSFFVSCEKQSSKRIRGSVFASAKYAGIKTIGRSVDGGLRFWRVA